MAEPATMIAPAVRKYRGRITDPALWAGYQPRRGDVIVTTPPKCGTTLTQTIIAMLLIGGPKLPGSLHAVSPWIDAAFDGATTVAEEFRKRAGRRVAKTHTPADGFPVWEGVTIVAVYRHPLDMFLSLRSHALNMKGRVDAMTAAPEEALNVFLTRPFDIADFDSDSLATVAEHYRRTALSGRTADFVLLHYADIVRDKACAVSAIAAALDLDAAPELIAEVTRATEFSEMKASAARFVPEAGKGYWLDDAAFFASGRTGKWQGVIAAAGTELYARRLGEELPDRRAREWLESGSAAL